MSLLVTIIPYTSDRFDKLVAFVASLNADGAHHIGYFGTDPADIAHGIRAADPPPEVGYRLAERDGRLVGVLGIEADAALGRAWLYGPLIDAPDWPALADQLYAAVQPAIPSGVVEHELFCDRRNAHVQAFAERHQFPLHSEAAILNFDRAQLASRSFLPALDLEDRFFPHFGALHRRLFPRTYASADQLIAKRGPEARILVETAGDRLLGYTCVKIEPAAHQAYIDYLGVAEDARRRGVAARLLTAALDWMFAHPAVQRADLTVDSGNQAALRLYTSLGFTTERTMRAYRKRIG